MSLNVIVGVFTAGFGSVDLTVILRWEHELNVHVDVNVSDWNQIHFEFPTAKLEQVVKVDGYCWDNLTVLYQYLWNIIYSRFEVRSSALLSQRSEAISVFTVRGFWFLEKVIMIINLQDLGGFVLKSVLSFCFDLCVPALIQSCVMYWGGVVLWH